jgi:hypothetical protein
MSFRRQPKGDPQAAWMRDLQRHVEELGGHPGQIDWASAVYLYREKTNVIDAAIKLIKIQGKKS